MCSGDRVGLTIFDIENSTDWIVAIKISEIQHLNFEPLDATDGLTEYKLA